MAKRWRNASGQRIRNEEGRRIIDDQQCCCGGGGCEYCQDSPRTVQVTIDGVVDQVDFFGNPSYTYSEINGTYVLPDFAEDSWCASAPGYIWPYSEGLFFVSVFIRGAEFDGAHPEFVVVVGGVHTVGTVTWQTRDHFGQGAAAACITTMQLPFDDARNQSGGQYFPQAPFINSTATVTVG